MQLGKGWHEWYVSTEYITKALTQLNNNDVDTKNIFIVPYTLEEMHADYLIIYKNEE